MDSSSLDQLRDNPSPVYYYQAFGLTIESP